MTDGLKKRSINLAGHATSVALEPRFWSVLETMAAGRSVTVLIGEIDAKRGSRPLASACRLAALDWALEHERPLSITAS
jgi:predicted DNA-binding ribbon-helix-helix protein